MNPTDIYDLQIALASNINDIFGIWIGFTFGAIVAVHFAQERLNAFLFILLEALYLLASIVFASRYLYTGGTIIHYNEMLISAGHEPHPLPSGFIMWAMASLFALGTIGTMGYGVYMFRMKDRAI